MRLPALFSSVTLCLFATACTVAPPPDQQSEAAQKAAQHNELRDAIQKPIDRAKAADAPVIKADEDREKALQDQGG